MKLSFDDSTVGELRQILEASGNRNGEIELEFRLGQFSFDNGKKKFVPGISKQIFDRVFRILKEQSLKHTVTKSEVLYYKDNIREIIEDGKKTLQRKEKIMNIDIEFPSIVARLGKSTELVVNNSNLGSVQFKRKRERHSFSFDNYNIELTLILSNPIVYEIEIEFNDSEIPMLAVIEPLKQILKIIYPGRGSMMLKSEHDNVAQMWNEVFRDDIARKNVNLKKGQFFRFELKPRNIKLKDVNNMIDMAVTNKLNGIGTNLFISKSAIYLVNTQSQVVEKVSSSSFSDYQGSIFPIEYKDDVCHIYDCIKFKYRDVSHIKNHSKRLNNAVIFVQELEQGKLDNRNNLKCEIKFFKYSGDLEQDTKDIVRYMSDRYGDKVMEHNDGIIFTPFFEQYLNNFTLKFKWIELMTIDFELINMTIHKNLKHFDLGVVNKDNDIGTFSKMDIEISDPFYNEVHNGMIVECGYDMEKNNWKIFKIRDDKVKPNFIGVAKDVFDDIEHPLELDKLINAFHRQKSESPKHTIGHTPYPNEFPPYANPEKVTFSNKDTNARWIEYRDKYIYNKQEDKNMEEDEEKIWQEYKEKEQKRLIESCKKIDDSKARKICELNVEKHAVANPRRPNSNSCLTIMRKEHNNEKRKMINEYLKDKTVIDFGFGKGGTIHAYDAADISYIYAVEPNIDYIKEAKKRLKEMKNKDFHKNVKIIHAGAQDSSEIKDQMKDKQADNGATFFSLTFSFGSENELDKWINTFAGTIKMGGYLVGNTMDGEMTYNFLKGKEKVEVPECFLIEKKYQDDNIFSFGKKIFIKLLEENTIVEGQEEYLVFYDILKDKMQKRGFHEVESSLFEPSNNVDRRAVPFSKLFRNFVFQRHMTDSEKKLLQRKEENEKQRKEERKNSLPMANIDENLAFKNHYGETAVFIRTGTVGEGSCAFHSILTSIDKVYRSLDSNRREEYVAKLRKALSDRLTMEKWISFGKGHLSYSLTVPRFIKYIEKEKLFPQIYDELHNDMNSMKSYIDNLSSILMTNLSGGEESHKQVNKLKKIFDIIQQRAFKDFKDKLRDCSAWVGQDIYAGSVDVFEYISDFFNIDIYILRDSTRKPYRMADCDVKYKNRKSIIVLWIGNSHYESVGVFNKFTKKIKRMFDYSDPIIDKIRNLTC